MSTMAINLTTGAAWSPGESQLILTAGEGSDLLGFGFPLPIIIGGKTFIATGLNGDILTIASGPSSASKYNSGTTVTVNVSGSLAQPPAISLSAAMDESFSSTQGAILYRDTALWLPLAPGTAGQVLTTQGTAANPTWTTPATGSGTIIFSCTGCAAVTNTTTSTTLFGSPTESTGSLTIAANSLNAGDVIWCPFQIQYSTTGTPTTTLGVFLGGTQIGFTQAIPTASGSSNAVIGGPFVIYVVSTGSSGSVVITGSAWSLLEPSTSSRGDFTTSLTGGGAPVTINTTISLALDFQLKWSAQSASNTATLNAFAARKN